MGRADRLRKQTIIDGKVLGIRDRRDRLMKEVIKLASHDLFFGNMRKCTVEEWRTQIGEEILKVLPQALGNLNERMFSLADITRDRDFHTMAVRTISGIGCTLPEIRPMDTKGHVFRMRRTKCGRKRTGEWRLCLDCGTQRYVGKESTWRRCRDCWRAWRSKSGKTTTGVQ